MAYCKITCSQAIGYRFEPSRGQRNNCSEIWFEQRGSRLILP